MVRWRRDEGMREWRIDDGMGEEVLQFHGRQLGFKGRWPDEELLLEFG